MTIPPYIDIERLNSLKFLLDELSKDHYCYLCLFVPDNGEPCIQMTNMNTESAIKVAEGFVISQKTDKANRN